MVVLVRFSVARNAQLFRTLFVIGTYILDPLLSCSRSFRKDAKKVQKLEAQIPYHEGRGNKEEVEKIKEQVALIWGKAREAQGLA